MLRIRKEPSIQMEVYQKDVRSPSKTVNVILQMIFEADLKLKGYLCKRNQNNDIFLV
jgi:uncharacterized lipoprotein YajG